MDWTGGLDWWTDIKNNFYAINETHLPVGVTNHWTEVVWTELDWTHKKVRNKLINHRKLGGGSSKVVCYKFEGAAPHAVALYLPGD